MGKVLPCIDDDLKRFIEAQHVFFVATAPLEQDGHVNVSPKGLDTLRILDERTVAYLDLTGSGIETVAHVKENGRIVLMFCAFEGPPLILRLHGRARAIEVGESDFGQLNALFPNFLGARSVIVVEVTRISTSCGFGVPLMQYQGERTQLEAWAKAKGEEGLRTYRELKNSKSIDDLPGFSGKAKAIGNV